MSLKKSKRMFTLTLTLIFTLILVMMFFLYIVYIFSLSNQISVSKIGFTDSSFEVGREFEFELSDSIIKNSIITYIENLRSIAFDKNTIFKNWEEAKTFSSSEMLKKLNQFWTDWDVYKNHDKNVLKIVYMESLEKQINNQYEVHWVEAEWRDSYFIANNRYYGYISYETYFPNEQNIVNKTLGLRITNFEFTKKEEF